MSESNMDRKPFVPSAPTLDWVVAMYFKEISGFFLRLATSSTRFYKFLWCVVFLFPLTMVLVILGQYADMKYSQYKMEQRIELARKEREARGG